MRIAKEISIKKLEEFLKNHKTTCAFFPINLGDRLTDDIALEPLIDESAAGIEVLPNGNIKWGELTSVQLRKSLTIYMYSDTEKDKNWFIHISGEFKHKTGISPMKYVDFWTDMEAPLPTGDL